MLKSIRQTQDGSISILLVLVTVALLGFVGLAIDMARGYAVKQHLQKAVDAATLAATKVLEEVNPDPDYPRTVGENYFWNNWRDGYLGAGPVTLTVNYDRNAGKATVNAKVDLEPVIMGFMGVNDFHFDTSAEAQRKKISLELAIALDNTASMALGAEPGTYNTVPSDVSKRRISLVKDAAKLLLDILYDGKPEIPNMYLSVIPFTSMVNVGNANTNFLKGGAGALSGLTWSPPDTINGLTSGQKNIYNNQREWRGCVFERGAGKRSGFNVAADYSGNDLTDAPPSVEAFYPYNVPPPIFYAGVNCRRDQAMTPPSTCYNWVCPPEGPCYKDPPAGYSCGGNPTRNKYNNNGFTDRDISTVGVKTTYVNGDVSSPNFGKYCQSSDPICVPNRGPARRCFPWETPEWNKAAPADTNYTLNPSTFWSGFPYSIPQNGDGGANNYNKAGTKDKNGSPVTLTSPSFTTSGFKVVVNNDDISACGNAANVTGGDTNGYYFCSNTSFTGTTDTFGRWIPSWPINATTTAEAKLGGWGNSGCGLPVLPLVTKYADVLGRINSMDVPVNDPANTPARGYYGTIINQGLVWAWRSISPNWRNLWSGAASTTLPFNYTSGTDVHNKAIVILTDGLNYMQRHTEITTANRTNYSTTLGWVDGSYNTARQPDHRDYDSTAYGRLLDKWFYKNGTSSLIAHNTTAPDEATKGQPAYQELNRRLLATCDNIRAKGIKIFLIAFAVDASPVKADANATFTSCVGTTGKYYDAVDEAALTDAFKDIAAQLVELRLVR